MFRAYLLDKVTTLDFRRLAQAIDLAFGDDLKILIDSHEDSAKPAEPWLRSLVGPGLAEVVGGKTWAKETLENPATMRENDLVIAGVD